MQIVDTIGYIGAFLTTISFLPQAIQTIKTKDTAGISFLMYVTFVIGVFFWLTYGILIQNPVIIVANSITLLLSGSVLWMKVKSKRIN